MTGRGWAGRGLARQGQVGLGKAWQGKATNMTGIIAMRTAEIWWSNIKLIGPRFLPERPDLVDKWFDACERVLQETEKARRG